jgi:hypothetical protein
LALGVLGAGAQEGYRGQYVIAAAIVAEPAQQRTCGWSTALE